MRFQQFALPFSVREQTGRRKKRTIFVEVGKRREQRGEEPDN
jgi:hypothetical protein